MEQLDHVAQPVAFATASLGLAESPQRELGRNGSYSSYSSGSDTEGSGRPRRALFGSRTKLQSPDGSSPTTRDNTHGPDAAKSSQLRQSVIDLRNEFDEIAEEGEYLPSYVMSQGDMDYKTTIHLIHSASSHLNLSLPIRHLKRRTALFALNSKGCKID